MKEIDIQFVINNGDEDVYALRYFVMKKREDEIESLIKKWEEMGLTVVKLPDEECPLFDEFGERIIVTDIEEGYELYVTLDEIKTRNAMMREQLHVK